MSHSPRRPRTARTVLVIAAALVATLLAPGAAGAQDKPYSVVLAPESVAGGSQTVVTATIVNRSAQQQLGSANLTAPAALTLAGAALLDGAAGSATFRDGVVELRDLALAPGGTVRVAVTVGAPCAAGTFTWSVVAKQANRFNGPPGNDLTLDPALSRLTTTVTDGCGVALRFFTPPQDARVGERLTGLDFDPTGPPVAVEVVDGAGERVASSTVAISLSFETAAGLGTLRGTTTVTAVAGLATFDANVDAAGTYSLRATAAGLQPAVTDPFEISQVAVECVEDVDCIAEASTPQSQVQATAFGNANTDAGFLQLSLNSGFRPDCADYQEFSAEWATIVGPDRQKLVVFTIDKRVMNASPNNGVSFLQMCFAAPFTFATRSGLPPERVGTWFVATLPDCGAPPCIAKRNKTKAGDGVIEVLAPAGTQDPAYRP